MVSGNPRLHAGCHKQHLIIDCAFRPRPTISTLQVIPSLFFVCDRILAVDEHRHEIRIDWIGQCRLETIERGLPCYQLRIIWASCLEILSSPITCGTLPDNGFSIVSCSHHPRCRFVRSPAHTTQLTARPQVAEPVLLKPNSQLRSVKPFHRRLPIMFLAHNNCLWAIMERVYQYLRMRGNYQLCPCRRINQKIGNLVY